MNIAIIGGGLAGTALAYTLKQAGLNNIELFESNPALASEASGNQTGLVNPRFSADRTPESDYYTSAYAQAIRTFDHIKNNTDNQIEWNKCGALHLMIDEKKEKRFPQTKENWQWPAEHMQVLSPEQASNIAGLPIHYETLYLPDSGTISPEQLCKFYAKNCTTHLNTSIKSLEELKQTHDIIILACGANAKKFDEAEWLPLNTVRGQITQIEASTQSKNLRCTLGFGGYASPAIKGIHTIGATFQRWLDHSNIQTEDDKENINKLKQFIPNFSEEFKVTNHRASVRATSKDHFPIVGKLPGHNQIYISAAHGSHGIISTLAAAHLLTDIILKRPYSQSLFTYNALSPIRFQNHN